MVKDREVAAADRKSGLKITKVHPNSVAEALDLRIGDRLLRINSHRIHDPIDYRFHAGGDEMVLEIEREGLRRLLSVGKEMDEDLGLEFAEPRYRTCINQCIFCFVNQMPQGLRRALYIKDDDYRLSFIHGNYITLTNMSDGDFERIFRQRLSPLYVSVHATDDAVRRKMLGNAEAPAILAALERLTGEGIRLHTQIVLCPGINDGEVLDRSIRDLKVLRPHVESVAIVPVGLTRFRNHMKPVQEVTRTYARVLLKKIGIVQEKCVEQFGDPWIFASDEFYLMAQAPFQPLETYGELPQLENGVGMVPLFVAGIEDGLECLPRQSGDKKLTIGTGFLAYPVLKGLVPMITRRTGAEIELIPIANKFFGASVTVSGLLTGSDLLHAFGSRKAPEALILPSNMVLSQNRSFLDGMTIGQVEAGIGCPLQFVDATSEGLLGLFQRAKSI
jgi:putative radical SAM enzyme (TIGR03279 family)